MNEERADDLLTDLVDSPDMEMNSEIISEVGGREHLIALGLRNG